MEIFGMMMASAPIIMIGVFVLLSGKIILASGLEYLRDGGLHNKGERGTTLYRLIFGAVAFTAGLLGTCGPVLMVILSAIGIISW